MNDFSYVPSDTYFSKNVDKNIIQLDCVPFCKGSSIIIIIYANDNFYRKREGGGWKMMINIITIYSDDLSEKNDDYCHKGREGVRELW